MRYYSKRHVCGECEMCWQKSLITKNSNDDGILCCYRPASIRSHQQVEFEMAGCSCWNPKRTQGMKWWDTYDGK